MILTSRINRVYFRSHSALISLTTPAAMVVPISLSANLPSCGNSVNVSRHNGLNGWIFTIAASPVFSALGFSSKTPPVRASSLETNSVIVAAACEVCACITGV